MFKTLEECKVEPFAKPLNLADFPHVHTSDLLKIVNYLPKCGVGGPWIAGGSVWRTLNNEPLNKCDVDVFFHDKEQFNSAVAQMDAYPLIRNVLQKTKNKYNMTYKIHANRGNFNKTIEVQFIHMKYHKSIDALLQSFDFTVCQFAWNGENVYSGSNSINDLRSRLIRIYKTGNPKSLFQHMLRYMENGFTMQNDETRKLISNIISLNPWDKSYSQGYNDSYNEKKKTAWEGYGNERATTATVGGERYVWGGENTGDARTVTPVATTGLVDMTDPLTPTTYIATTGLVDTTDPLTPYITTTPHWTNMPNEEIRNENVGWNAELTDDLTAEDRPTPTPATPVRANVTFTNGRMMVNAPMEATPERAAEIDRGFLMPVQENIREVAEERPTITMNRPMNRVNAGVDIENEIEHRMNAPRNYGARPPRGPARFDEDRTNPQFRNAFGQTEHEVMNAEIRRRADNGEQQERREGYDP